MTASKPKPSRKRAWLRFAIYLILLIIGLLFGGFIAFSNHVSRIAPPNPIPQADGIVVWTGKGGGRLETGAQLLTDGFGERLFISGVNTSVSEDKIISLLGVSGEVGQCCVDLDYAAENTIGNARETAAWALAWGYEHIILVTSAYHMPRAQIEISAVAGRMRITPYPVAPDVQRNWWSDGPTFRRLSQEYGKLLLTYLRDPGSENHRGTPPLKQPGAKLENNSSGD